MIETTTGLLAAPAISVSIPHRPVIGSGITMLAGYRVWQGYSVLARPRCPRIVMAEAGPPPGAKGRQFCGGGPSPATGNTTEDPICGRAGSERENDQSRSTAPGGDPPA